MRADVAGLAEAIGSAGTPTRLADRRRTPSSVGINRLGPHLVEHALGKPLDLPGHHLNHGQHRRGQAGQHRVSAANVPMRTGKSSRLACRPLARPRVIQDIRPSATTNVITFSVRIATQGMNEPATSAPMALEGATTILV